MATRTASTTPAEGAPPDPSVEEPPAPDPAETAEPTADGEGEPDGDSGRAGGEEALRADLARERRRRQERERELADLRASNESEAERREREARETASRPAIRALRASAVETAAREAGFLYPEDAFALLTGDERDSVDVDLDAGDLPAVDRDAAKKLVAALAKRRPALIRTAEEPTPSPGGADSQGGGRRPGTPSSKSDPNAQLRDLFRKRTTRL